MIFGRKDDDFDIPEFSGDRANALKELVFGERNQKRRTILGILLAILFFIVSYCSGMIVAIKRSGNLVAALGRPPHEYILFSITTLEGWLYIIICAVVVGFLFYVIGRKNQDLNQIKGSDDRGVDFSEKGVYGTAEWMSRKEAEKVYEVCPIDKAEGVILGQFSDEGKEVICLKRDTPSNRNILILGSPGTGKSFCYVRNAIFQSIVREESVVVTDPKGELYESTSEKLRQEGYKVWVFNLVDPKRSDAWDCVREIYDPVTGNVDDGRVTDLVDTIMKNTAGDGGDDHFWGTGESNLMKAVVHFCAWRRETTLKAMYEYEGKSLFSKVSHMMSIRDGELLMSKLSTDVLNNATMNEREKVLRILIKASLSKDYTLEKVDEYIEKIKHDAPPCNMSTIYHMLVTCDIQSLEEKFRPVPISHPASIAWNIFAKGSDKTQPGMIQGLGQRLQIFETLDVRRITTNDDIRLGTLGDEKIALFCIISDNSTAMKALSSLFFNFLFKDVSQAADRAGSKNNKKYVNVICDEFANLGSIPSFDVTISTVRSRKINISIILQSVMQLQKNYDDASQTIISCCDTILFLGCNDTETAEFISELSGVASIRVLSTRDSRNTSLGNRTVMQGYQISEGDGKRNLLNPDEVRRLPRSDVLIYHNGCNILQAHRCGFIHHRFYDKEEKYFVKLSDYPLAEIKYSVTADLDAFVQGDMMDMTRRNKEIVFNKSIDKGIEDSQQRHSQHRSDDDITLNTIDGDEGFGF